MSKKQDDQFEKLVKSAAARYGEGWAELFTASLAVMEKRRWSRAALAGQLMRITDLLTEMEKIRSSPSPVDLDAP